MLLGWTTLTIQSDSLKGEISHEPRTLKVELYLIDSPAFVHYINKLHHQHPCVSYLFLPFEFSLNNYTYLCNWMNQGLKKFGLWFISNKSFWTLHWRLRRSLFKREERRPELRSGSLRTQRRLNDGSWYLLEGPLLAPFLLWTAMRVQVVGLGWPGCGVWATDGGRWRGAGPSMEGQSKFVILNVILSLS